MTEHINVSVIFATYNRADIIADVLKQWVKVDKNTKYSYEIICSDDDSKDRTVEIIEQFEGLPLTVLRNEHGGASRARNAALKLAKGEIIIFTGDDIFPDVDFINRHYENHLKYGDKICTLGRIEWHQDIPLNHLMYHITNVGCEQFGFAGLIPYALTDFRHFYTSNISVSKKELDRLGQYFDLTFDRYGFEDIELGYRLYQNGVMIYYDADIVVYHHHIYNDVEKFCNRQYSAGNQMVVLTRLHDSIRYNEVMGISHFENALNQFARKQSAKVSKRGTEILDVTEKCKERTRELEQMISEEDKAEDRAECSALYRYIFQFSFYMGWGCRFLETEALDSSQIAELVFDYMYALGYVQVFHPINAIYQESHSVYFPIRDTQVRIENEVSGVSEIRLDPYDFPCRIYDFSAIAYDEKERKTRLRIATTNGMGKHGLDFSNTDDPQIYLTGFKPEHKYRVEFTYQIQRYCDVVMRLQREIQKEKDQKRNYAKPVYQTRKLNIIVQNQTNTDIKDILEEYQAFLREAYGDDITLTEQDINIEFRSNYYYEVKERPMPLETFRIVIQELCAVCKDGVVLPDGSTIFMTSLTERAKKELPQYSEKEALERYPMISVVIPSYNHEHFIAQAIESVLHQSYPNIELIVIDDGSQDGSVDVIRSYQDQRLTCIIQENAGAHQAINRGLQMAKGDYLAILNSDDSYLPRRFERMMTEMKKHDNVAFACSYIQVIDSEGNVLGIKEGWHNMDSWLVPHPELSYKSSDDFDRNLIMTNFTATTSNFLFSKSLYQKIGGMRNLRYVHDWDFALRAAQVANCMIVDQPLMRYRVHGTNTISSNRKWMLFEIAWIWAANLERFYHHQIFNDNNDGDEIVRLAESLNLQGNDKVFWMIKVFLEVQKAKGVEHPEEILLDDADLRAYFLNYVVE